ncbi:MAG: amidohydrolase family protein [Armatimonadota bacterium]|jgi:predicted TIM-barrel fold metal-dependent hydrolase
MPRLRFFDGNAMVGWRSAPHPETIWSVTDFARDYEYYGIGAALVYHASAMEYHQDFGNRLLLDEIRDAPGMIPQWVLMPHHTHEIASADELIPEMLEMGVRSARIFPKTHGWPMTEQVAGPLLAALQERRVPVFIDLAEIGIDGAASLCERCPELPVILCGVAWGTDRQIEPALERAPNLYLETHSFQGHRAYERIARQFGAERLIFGTGLPDCSPGAAMMMSLYEDISDEERAQIAGGNLLGLLQAVETDAPCPLDEVPAVEPPTTDDPIVATMREGRPLTDEFIFDAHGHIGHEGSMGIARMQLPWIDGDGLVGTMDRLGIDRCIVSTWSGITHGDPASNDIMLRAVEKHPDRLLAFGTINPRYPEAAADEMRRVFETGRVIGYKPYPPRQQVPLTDVRHRPMLEWADRRGAPVLCHGGLSPQTAVTPDQLAYLAPMYPNAKFLLGHAGSSWALAEALVSSCRRWGNVYAEITYTSILYGLVEYFVRELGRERTLFGTDCVMRDAAPQLGWAAWARIPLEDKRMVLGGNIASILGI